MMMKKSILIAHRQGVPPGLGAGRCARVKFASESPQERADAGLRYGHKEATNQGGTANHTFAPRFTGAEVFCF